MRNPLTNIYNSFRDGLRQQGIRLQAQHEERFDRIERDLLAIKCALVVIGLGVLALLVRGFW